MGMTDLVAALHWVQENISNFGEDPDRVMIYGQSGGGSKVTTLLGMPSAVGLIHRASAAQSGRRRKHSDSGAAKRNGSAGDEGSGIAAQWTLRRCKNAMAATGRCW